MVFVDAEEDGDDGVAEAHCDGAGDHDGFAAEFVDVEDGGNGGEEHGYARREVVLLEVPGASKMDGA